MSKIQLSYLYPSPDPSIKYYEIRNTLIEKIFLERLINIKGLPYYEGVEGPVLFMDGQYNFDQIQNILRKNENTL